MTQEQVRDERADQSTEKQDERDSNDRHETEGQRLDRNVDEMLQSCALPNRCPDPVRFLMTIRFQQRFPEITTFQRNVYVTT